jgi:hypothetical protein
VNGRAVSSGVVRAQFLTHIITGVLMFKELNARRFYKTFGVKGLIW